jgi:imidazolonepropionase-like amidohydrolase
MIEHPLPRTDEVIQKMAARGVEADPTLVPYAIIFEDDGGYFESTSRRFTFSPEANLQLLRKLRGAGIKLGVATDLVSDWFLRLPAPYIAELTNFVRAGFSLPEALVNATKINAELLDMDDKLGTLQPGKLADILVANGAPDEKVEDLAKVEWVIRDGEVIVEHGQPRQLRHVPLVPARR